jgi:riboflavin kinase/FMN adenylyltransferase
MRLIRGVDNLHPTDQDCVATIGTFDGVHLGHQAVLRQLAEKHRELHLPAVVVTFEPHPSEYFMPDSAPPRLTRLREKIQLLETCSVDRVLCLRFDQYLATMSAQDFIKRIVVDDLRVHCLVVGDDFRFGAGRQGDFPMLQCAGANHGFSVVTTPTFDMDGVRVSSTRVREALACGDLELAARLLGRPYRLCGRVAYGDQRGRTLGFPTANIHLQRRGAPVRGVFAAEVSGLNGGPAAGIANVGARPTVDGTHMLLEIHVFDFDRDIYGRYVAIDFLSKLRDEKRFQSLEALKRQIEIDAQQARAYFRQRAGNRRKVKSTEYS